jgi:chemotaxis protein methyltransferase CheR
MAMAPEEFEIFKSRVYNKIGLDLNKYKEKQLKRRIVQFMGRYNTSSFSCFYSLLDSDPTLLSRFKDFLTINTSEFFRDIRVFDTIAEIMGQVAQKPAQVKIWSAGCSIGAEPYSLAILAEEAGIKNYSILATDYDINALQRAREGIYASDLLKNVAPAYQTRYFSQSGDKYLVKSNLKTRIAFREHNLLKNPFPTDYDLILCRNVFIYFNQDVQQELIHHFINSLKPQGYFIIGSSEFIPYPEKYCCRKVAASVYQKTKTA